MKQLIALMALLLAGQWVMGQAALEISVLDSENEPVPGLNVEISNARIGYESGRVTNEQGKIRLDGLSTSGEYTVATQKTDLFGASSVEGIVLISDKTSSVTIAVASDVSVESVTIQDASVTINTVDGRVASELTRREIAELPVEGRDITRALYRLPNISQATGFFPEAPNVAINGANSLYTNYQIDGLDNNENFLGGQRFAMPVGFTQNITAYTNNFSAEHGLTSNGVINITTRSGTNDYGGEVFYVTRPGPAIDASSTYAQRDLSGNQVQDGFMRQQFGFGVGGPIKKDQTFFFLNVEHTRDVKDNLLNSPELGVNETVRGVNNFTYVSGKLDHYWNQRWRSSLRVNSGTINIDRQGGGLEGGVTFPSAGNEQDRNSLNVALKNTYVGDNFIYEGNYQYGSFRWNYADPENPNSPNVTVLDPVGLTIATLGHPGYVFDENELAHVLQQKFTFYKGRHTFKAGAQLRSHGYELFGGGNPNGSYLVQLNQNELDGLVATGIGSSLSPSDIPSSVNVLNYSVELRPNSFTNRQNIYSIYAEDQFSATSRLNLNVGLRYDYDDLSVGGASSGDLNNIAPRVSANYKLDANSSIRGGYGIYYDKVLYAVVSDALQFSNNSADFKAMVQELVDQGVLPASTDVDAVTNEGNLGASVPNVNYLEGPAASTLLAQRDQAFGNEFRILNPNGYDNPYSHQFMLGYQRRVDSELSFYVDLMHNRSYNLFRIRDLNAPSAYPIDPDNVVVRSQADADLTRTIPIQTDASGNFAVVNGDTLRGISRGVIMTEAGGRSNYYAANFTLQKERGDDNYAIRLMYTLSLLENNTEDINFRAMDSNDFEAEWGPSINDRRHIINGIFNYYPHKNLTFTLASLIQSGQPINRVPDATIYGTTDLNGDGRSFGDAYVGNSDRSPGEERNSDRLPWSTTFDASAYYNIPVGENKIELGASVFNVFNAVNLSGYSNNATQSNQIQAGPASSGLLVRRNAAPPRQFQFSARYLF